MNSDAIRKAMLDCSPGCRVQVLKSAVNANLCWIGSTGVHTERIPKDKLAVASKEFQSALERATEALKGQVMNILKAQRECNIQAATEAELAEATKDAEEAAKACMLEMKAAGVKVVMRGSALIWLENAYNNVQTANAMNAHGLHTVDLIGDDKAVFLASLQPAIRVKLIVM